ncbi:MAG: AclJ-like protein [Actinomycetia bacterium]|jgi:deazaflavin-dependent oxidoreductase (nitroreductase family)|nr:AclJ-like protein [Actinomycetes bacterium]
MPAVRLNPILRVMWKLHRDALRVSGGRVGSRMGSMRVLLRETTGHKSGQPRTVGLSYLHVDGRYFVMASYAGEDRDPAWAKNLRAYPRATVTIGGRSIPVVARALEGSERQAMFERFVEADASYEEYRERTTREIPAFELRPEGV